MNDRISESEWTLMELLWQEEMTQPQLAEKLGKRWNKNTVHTFLTRLCAKGFLQVDKERPARSRNGRAFWSGCIRAM